MIDLHYAPTPNGWKISIMLEELGASLSRSFPSTSAPASSSGRNFWRSARTTGFRPSWTTRRPTAASRFRCSRPGRHPDLSAPTRPAAFCRTDMRGAVPGRCNG